MINAKIGTMPKEKFVIIDAHALIHRAYHALPSLTTKSGEVVNAVYGFSVILLKVISELKPKYIALAFDLPDQTFRHQEYAEYKANRPPAPDDLISQFYLVREVVQSLNIPIFEKPGYEADDIIGTLAKKAKKIDGLETFIVTGDLDELQLVDEKTKVYTMKRGFTDTIIYDQQAVKERYGLTPGQFVDFKALKGDPSDNIPGVSGIGEKTAIELVKEYNNLDNIYQNISLIKPKIAEKLINGKDQARLSKKLSQIVTDLPIAIKLSACETAKFDRKKVIEIFQRLEFRSLINKLPMIESSAGKKRRKTGNRNHYSSKNYHLVNELATLRELKKKLIVAKTISIDTETDSLDPVTANLVGISLAVEEGQGYYLPVGHKEGKQLELETVISELKPVIESKIPKIGHNLKYDYQILLSHGITIKSIAFDTMIAAYLLNPASRAQKLGNLAFNGLGIEMMEIGELIGKGKDQTTFAEVEIEKATLYAAEDADIAMRLYNRLSKEIKKNDLEKLLTTIEIPLITILARMETAGVKIDDKKLAEQSKRFSKTIKSLEKDIYGTAGCDFNLDSPKQLQKILFESLKLQDGLGKNELKKLPTGGFSTGAEELEKLKKIHPIVESIIRYRELSKLKNTYLDALPELINEKTKRIHTSFNQAITATGRLSSSNPNLQNIPIRSNYGKEIRKTFIAEDGYSIIAADYSQIELRVISHIANDTNMKTAFIEEEDVHSRTAAQIYGVELAKVTKEMRNNAKVVNFGVVYGVSAHGLARQSDMDYMSAKDFIEKYFLNHPGIAKYIKEVVDKAKAQGYTQTLYGRKRYLPELKSANFAVRNAAERMAMNMPIQGTAADILKMAMIKIDQELTKISPKSRMILTVHDELVFETPDTDVNKVIKFVREKMENIVKLSVPIKIEIGVAKNWGDAK